MEREDLKRIRSMKLANDRRQDWTAKCRRDRNLFLIILTLLVILLGAILVQEDSNGTKKETFCYSAEHQSA